MSRATAKLELGESVKDTFLNEVPNCYGDQVIHYKYDFFNDAEGGKTPYKLDQFKISVKMNVQPRYITSFLEEIDHLLGKYYDVSVDKYRDERHVSKTEVCVTIMDSFG